jgi:hypothetical protein
LWPDTPRLSTATAIPRNFSQRGDVALALLRAAGLREGFGFAGAWLSYQAMMRLAWSTL